MCLEQSNTGSFRFFVIQLNVYLKGNNGLYNFPRGINQMSETNFCIHEFMNASDVVYHLEHENETVVWSLRAVLLSSELLL